MTDMKIRYIGNFPPPYGGVTIKNKLLFEGLSQSVEIRHFNLAAQYYIAVNNSIQPLSQYREVAVV